MNPPREAPAPLRLRRFITINDIIDLTSWSRASIYALGDPDSGMYDPTWPRPIRLGKKKIVWDLREVEAHFELKAATCRVLPKADDYGV